MDDLVGVILTDPFGIQQLPLRYIVMEILFFKKYCILYNLHHVEFGEHIEFGEHVEFADHACRIC